MKMEATRKALSLSELEAWWAVTYDILSLYLNSCNIIYLINSVNQTYMSSI